MIIADADDKERLGTSGVMLAGQTSPEKSWLRLPARILADLVLFGAAAVAKSSLDGFSPSAWTTAAVVTFAIPIAHGAARSYAVAATVPRLPWWLHVIVLNGTLALLLPWAARGVGLDQAANILPAVLLVATPLQLGLHALARRLPGLSAEPLRLALLLAATVTVGFPLLTNRQVGTGDAYWYATMVGDFVTQWRAGIFPVFAGQSEFAFNGAISPIRLAPYLQHAAGFLDMATFRSLSFFGLVNVTVFLSLAAGAISAYGTLAAIAPRLRWTAFLLALLYVSSPAAMALVYAGDLFMSVCTLPYLPLLILGLHRSLESDGRDGSLMMAVAAAALWLSHAPIALWATAIAALGQLIRLAPPYHASARPWRQWTLALAVFVSLSLYVFVSNVTLGVPAANVEPTIVSQGLRDAYPHVLLPLYEGSDGTGKHQLGWSLTALLALGIGAAVCQRRRWQVALTLGAGVMLVLVVPLPGLLEWSWKVMPQVVTNITFYAPLQRFCIILSILALFLFHGTWAGLLGRSRIARFAATAGLLAAVSWSFNQADALVLPGLTSATPPEKSRQDHSYQNLILTRYAYNPFPAYPAYFSHGYVDPRWEHRILAADGKTEIDSNARAAVGSASVVREEGDLAARPYAGAARYFALLDGIALEPGRYYALDFTFNHPTLAGTFVSSARNITRVYDLPDSGIGVPLAGPPQGFGSLPSSKHAMSLFNPGPGVDHFSAQFVTASEVKDDISRFGHYTLREYDPARLPVQVKSWAPYRGTVTVAAAGWLETPRIFTAGYSARVNGRARVPARSPGGQVMIPLEPGENRFELDFPGPVALRISYFVTLAGWLVVIAAAGRRLARPGSPAT